MSIDDRTVSPTIVGNTVIGAIPHSETCRWRLENQGCMHFLCSGSLQFIEDKVRCRYATRAEADDLVQRLKALQIPDLGVEIVERAHLSPKPELDS
jgi:hypothetical protein